MPKETILTCNAPTSEFETMPCNCGDKAIHLVHAKTGEHSFICASPACPTNTNWFAKIGDAMMAWELSGLITLN